MAQRTPSGYFNGAQMDMTGFSLSSLAPQGASWVPTQKPSITLKKEEAAPKKSAEPKQAAIPDRDPRKRKRGDEKEPDEKENRHAKKRVTKLVYDQAAPSLSRPSPPNKRR